MAEKLLTGDGDGNNITYTLIVADITRVHEIHNRDIACHDYNNIVNHEAEHQTRAQHCTRLATPHVDRMCMHA